MATSIFTALVTSVLNALKAPTALAGGRVYANRLAPFPPEVSTAIVVRLVGTEQVPSPLGVADWQTTLAVDCYARGALATDPAVSVDDLLCTTWARLAGISADTLAAMQVSRAPGVEWQFDDTGGAPVAVATTTLRVLHRAPSTTSIAV